MKKLIKRLSVYLTVAMLLCCSLFVTASASTMSAPLTPHKTGVDQIYHNWEWISSPGNYASRYMLRPGEYSIDCLFDLSSVEDLNLSSFMAVYYFDNASNTFVEIDFSSFSHFVVTEQMLSSNFGATDRCFLVVHSTGAAPVVTQYQIAEDGNGLYYEAFDLFADCLYGRGVNLTAEQNMVLTILATTAVLFVVLVPFLVVYFIIRLFG